MSGEQLDMDAARISKAKRRERVTRDMSTLKNSMLELAAKFDDIYNTGLIKSFMFGLNKTEIKTMTDILSRYKFRDSHVTEFDCPRIITSTIARLRTEHLKGMKIHPDKTRSYVQCKHCPDLQLTPNHILECATVSRKLLKMGMVPLRDSLRELLYSPVAPRIAEAMIKIFDGI
ncbi:hypothetical protein TNCV_2870721 [Trichonephila clavipes]|nr:hypothetical protein TNCV_2870721 [Trichonephila clavipes]